MVAARVVVVDELGQARFELTGQVVVLEQDPGLIRAASRRPSVRLWTGTTCY